MNNELLLIMVVHVFWTAMLYTTLTVMRAPKIWGLGLKANGTNPWQTLEPRVSANLSNQFEWPLFFYAICIILLTNPSLYKPLYFWLACIFLLGRFIHSAVHIFTENIKLRGIVFTINFIAVLLMWVILGFSVI